MTSDGLKLAELLCARLCHDLAGLVGAVAAGAELLTEEDGTGLGGEAVALLENSAAAAVVRLRFLRATLGSAGADVAASALHDLAAAFLAQPAVGAEAVELIWRDGETGVWKPEPAKLVLNLVLLARDCLPRGGRIEVAARQAGGTGVSARGKGAMAGESAAALAAASPEGLGPRGAQGFYAARVAERCGKTVTVRSAADLVEFRLD